MEPEKENSGTVKNKLEIYLTSLESVYENIEKSIEDIKKSGDNFSASEFLQNVMQEHAFVIDESDIGDVDNRVSSSLDCSISRSCKGNKSEKCSGNISELSLTNTGQDTKYKDIIHKGANNSVEDIQKDEFINDDKLPSLCVNTLKNSSLGGKPRQNDVEQSFQNIEKADYFTHKVSRGKTNKNHERNKETVVFAELESNLLEIMPSKNKRLAGVISGENEYHNKTMKKHVKDQCLEEQNCETFLYKSKHTYTNIQTEKPESSVNLVNDKLPVKRRKKVSKHTEEPELDNSIDKECVLNVKSKVNNNQFPYDKCTVNENIGHKKKYVGDQSSEEQNCEEVYYRRKQPCTNIHTEKAKSSANLVNDNLPVKRRKKMAKHAEETELVNSVDTELVLDVKSKVNNNQFPYDKYIVEENIGSKKKYVQVQCLEEQNCEDFLYKSKQQCTSIHTEKAESSANLDNDNVGVKKRKKVTKHSEEPELANSVDEELVLDVKSKNNNNQYSYGKCTVEENISRKKKGVRDQCLEEQNCQEIPYKSKQPYTNIHTEKSKSNVNFINDNLPVKKRKKVAKHTEEPELVNPIDKQPVLDVDSKVDNNLFSYDKCTMEENTGQKSKKRGKLQGQKSQVYPHEKEQICTNIHKNIEINTKFHSENSFGKEEEEKNRAWNSPLAQSVVQTLVEVMNIETIEELEGVKISENIWQQVADKINVPSQKISNYWYKRLHIQIFATKTIFKNKIYRKLIKWLKKNPQDDLDNVSWSDAVSLVHGSTESFMLYMFKRMTKKIAPDHDLSDFKGLVDLLYENRKSLKTMVEYIIPRYCLQSDGTLIHKQ